MGIGFVVKRVPTVVESSEVLGQWAGAALLLYFGLRTLKDAWEKGEEAADEELADAEEEGAQGSGVHSLIWHAQRGWEAGGKERLQFAVFSLTGRFMVNQLVPPRLPPTAVKSAEQGGKIHVQQAPFQAFMEVASLIFVAEWGDRSMLATIALGAAQSPLGVASGAILAHAAATLVAVVGGAVLSQHISERKVAFFSGVAFLVFAAATIFGVL